MSRESTYEELRKRVEELEKECAELKQAGRALRQNEAKYRTQNELERLVKERTTKLVETNQRLRQEIEERKRAEEALKQANSRLVAIFNTIPGMINAVDRDYNIIDVSDTFRRSFCGKKKEDIIGRKCYAVYKRRTSVCPECLVRRVYETGKLQTRFSSPEGERRTNSKWKIYAAPILDRQGEIGGAIEFAMDITDLKLAAEALRESEQKYRLLVENQTDLVVKVDPEWRFLFVSPSYCKLFGKTEDELLGRKFMTLLHEHDRESTYSRAIEKLCRPPYTAYLEERAMTKEAWRWLAWVFTAVRDESGGVVAIVGVGRDITEKVKGEEILRRQGEYLLALHETSLGLMN